MTKRIDEEVWEKHPSYGHVHFSRVSIGGGSKHRLFGSALDNHRSTIMLRISTAERVHRLGHDWTSSAGGKGIVEVELSQAQFAELITTMNVGTGVPCTIRYRADVGQIENPPDKETEVDRSRESLRESLVDTAKRVRERMEPIENILGKLSKKAREEVEMAMRLVVQEITSSAPFYLEQFRESVAGLDALGAGSKPEKRQLKAPGEFVCLNCGREGDTADPCPVCHP